MTLTFPSNPATGSCWAPFARKQILASGRWMPVPWMKSYNSKPYKNTVFVFSLLLVSVKIHRQEWRARSKWNATAVHPTCQAQLRSIKSAERGIRNAAGSGAQEDTTASVIRVSTPTALGHLTPGTPTWPHTVPSSQGHLSEGEIWALLS